MMKEKNLYGHLYVWDQLSGSFLREVCRKYHYREEDFRMLESVAADMKICIKDREGFELVIKENDVEAAITLGEGLDRLQEKYSGSDRLMQQWMLENISGELLMRAYDRVADFVRERTKKEIKAYHFWGADQEHPIEKMPEILKEFHTIGMSGTKDFCLKPAKSVLFRIELADLPMDRRQKCKVFVCAACPRRKDGTCDIRDSEPEQDIEEVIT